MFISEIKVELGRLIGTRGAWTLSLVREIWAFRPNIRLAPMRKGCTSLFFLTFAQMGQTLTSPTMLNNCENKIKKQLWGI
jgi:hypothetical protein